MVDANDTALLATLPPTLRAIIMALGLQRAQVFLQSYGGRYIRLPKKTGAALDLTDAELVALRAALARHLGHDDRIALPKCDKIFIWFRDHEIRRKKQAGSSLNELANRFKLTSRHIQNICREVAEESDQIDIFIE